MDETMKVYPSVEELQTVNTNVRCTEDGCTSVFTSESNLALHLTKTHKKPQLTSDKIQKEFHCPEFSCMYHDQKYFKTGKLLKQHYLKVHGEKNFICQNCNKGFPTLASKNGHVDYCGVQFKCCDCETTYSAYESLLTHGRRKKHAILEKMAYKPKASNYLSDNSSSTGDIKKLKVESFILPKGSTSLHLVNYIPIVAKHSSVATSEKGSQTDIRTDFPKFKTKRTQVHKEKWFRRHFSKHTQTGHKKPNLTAETQTIGDYITRKSNGSDLSVKDLVRKNINTQTKPVNSKTQSCNTSFDFNESDFILDNIGQRYSSSTQTITTIPTELIYSTSTATHDSIHTDTSDLNFEFIHSSSQTNFNDDLSFFDSSNFFNCNIETQTDFMLDNDILNYTNCYSDIHTQTNISPMVKDTMISLPPYCNSIHKDCDDLLFNSSHTQTVLDDIARSVESQTMISHSKLNYFMGCRDMAHTETQTEIDFKNILEEINA